MALIIRSDYSEDRMMQDILRQEGIIMDEIVEAYIASGDAFVEEAVSQVQNHDLGTYLDQTTDLRNSIGYFVFRDGELIHEVNNGPMTPEDCEDVILKKGIQLFGFAGMFYASYVESKGYNVISNQAEVCMVDLTDFLERAATASKEFR